MEIPTHEDEEMFGSIKPAGDEKEDVLRLSILLAAHAFIGAAIKAEICCTLKQCSHNAVCGEIVLLASVEVDAARLYDFLNTLGEFPFVTEVAEDVVASFDKFLFCHNRYCLVCGATHEAWLV